MKHFLIFTFLVVLTSQSFAQRHCATDTLHRQKKLKAPELYKIQEDYKDQLNQIIQGNKAERLSGVNDIYSIPVVVHVIYNNTASTNISDAQVLSQIEVLNEDFRKKVGTNGYNTNPIGADVKIEFCLASVDPNGGFTSGIVRVYNSKSNWDVTWADQVGLKSLSYWPSDQYLNIWVCVLSSGYLGYAEYPVGSSVSGPQGGSAELDGVVIDYRAFGTVGTAGSSPHGLYNLGRTTTHEIGHWLGLLHIWGEGSGCGTDYVADTPVDEGPNDDADCIDASDCDGNSISTPDMTENYLDYSPDVCMNLFTIGQKDRMRAVMESAPRRMALLASTGCCASATPPIDGPIAEDFESGTVPSSWTVHNPDATSPEWTVSSPGAYGKSSFSILMENDLAGAGQVDTFESSYIKFHDIKPVLEFDLAYANNSSAETDSLVIYYGLGCSWYPLAKMYGSSLITTTRITDNFLPLPEDWKKIRVDLDPLDNRASGRIRFVNYSKSVNNLYIDNINIYKTPDQLNIHPYPNPAREALKVIVEFPDVEDVRYELYDLLGQKVYDETDHQQSNYTKIIDLTSISRGMYILRVSTRSQKAIKKIILY